MKNENKYTLCIAAVILALGLLLCTLAIQFHDSPLASISAILGGVCAGLGIARFYRYFYWSRPEHSQEYQETVEAETIDHDERREMLRGKAHRLTWKIMQYVYYAFALLMLLLLNFEWIDLEEAIRLLLLLLVLWLLQGSLNHVLFYWLNRKN